MKSKQKDRDDRFDHIIFFDKAKWVQKHFDSDRPDGVFYKRLILSHHKNMCVQLNAWLIDDRKAHGSECFGEHFIHFGSEKFPITAADIQKWCASLVADGISKSTIGMYLRSFRVAWYACEKLGYVLHNDYPFGKDDELVSIPKGNTRKSFYLTVDQMTEMYNCFLEKRYPEEWDVDWKENTHYSLGLFLVQYLGNGFNLADAAHLTYNDHYFQSGKKSFHFVRQKTEDRSDMEVVIPIIPPLQTILDQIAAPPIKGSLVFPGIYGDA